MAGGWHESAESAVLPQNNDQDKVMVCGLAHLLNNAEALAKGTQQNLPVTDALTEQQIVSTDFDPSCLLLLLKHNQTIQLRLTHWGEPWNQSPKSSTDPE